MEGKSQSLPWKYVKPSSHLIRSIDGNAQICNRKSSLGPKSLGFFSQKYHLSSALTLYYCYHYRFSWDSCSHIPGVLGRVGRAEPAAMGQNRWQQETCLSQPSPWLGQVPWPQLLVSLFQQHIPLPTLPSAKPFPSKRPSSRSSREKVRGEGHPIWGLWLLGVPPGCPHLVADVSCPLCVTQVPRAVTCLFITCPRSSGTRSSRRCFCLSATSSLPKSLWTVPPTRVNALVSPRVWLSLVSQLRAPALPSPQLKVPAILNIAAWSSGSSSTSQLRSLAVFSIPF